MKQSFLFFFYSLLFNISFVTVQAQDMKSITVGRGETFELLAKRYNITVEAIKEANPYVTKCRTGVKLNIPLPPPKPVVDTHTYTSEPTMSNDQASQGKSGSKFWGILAAGLLGGTAAYMQSQAYNPAPTYRGPVTTAFPTNNVVTVVPDASLVRSGRYAEYTAQVQARLNQQANNWQQSMSYSSFSENIGKQIGERALKMGEEQWKWILDFKNKNGRYPTDWEKSEWVKQHYPDQYDSYMAGLANMYNTNSDNNTSPNTDSEEKETKSMGGSSEAVRKAEEKYKQYVEEKINRPCGMCVGKGGIAGKCYFCVDGYRTEMLTGTRRCVSCKTSPGVCEYCHGTGKANHLTH